MMSDLWRYSQLSSGKVGLVANLIKMSVRGHLSLTNLLGASSTSKIRLQDCICGHIPLSLVPMNVFTSYAVLSVVTPSSRPS